MKTSLAFFLLIFGFALKVHSQIPIYDYATLQSEILKKNDVLYVVNFWSTTCKPCVEEMPYFQALQKSTADNPKVKIVLVSLDFKKDLNKRVVPFVQKRNIKSDVILLHDPKRMNEWIYAINPKWDGSIPATIWYKNGKSLHFNAGKVSKKSLFGITRKNL